MSDLLLIEKEQLKKELFEHLYFFEHFTTKDGVSRQIYRKDRIKFVREYFDRFDEIPTLAIENFLPDTLFKFLFNDSKLTTHSQVTAEIQKFIEADMHGFFLQAEGRTNNYRGEFSLEFYQAIQKGQKGLDVIQKVEHMEHRFDKTF